MSEIKECNSDYKTLVSVVMPVYNAGIYLKDAISDILNQTNKDFELICVDDGSTDKSLQILEYFAEQDNRIKIISQGNEGAGAARNAGMKLAQGEYLLFLDADDRFENKLLEKATELAKSTEADIVLFGSDGFINDTGVITGIIPYPKPQAEGVYSYKDMPRSLFSIHGAVIWNKLYRKSYIDKIQLKFQQTPYMNDVFFSLISVAKANEIVYLDSVLMHYRQGQQNTISGYKIKAVHPEYAFEILRDVKNELVNSGIFQNLRLSYANVVAELILPHLDMVTPNNYTVYMRYLTSEFLSETCLNVLTKDDMVHEYLYDKVECLCKIGFIAFLCMNFNNKYQELEYLRDELFKIESSKGKCYSLPSSIIWGSKIVLFGAGYRGKESYDNINKNDYCKIVAWIDSRATTAFKDNSLIREPEYIMGLSYDYILIAVEDFEIMMEIREMLMRMGISRERIVW